MSLLAFLFLAPPIFLLGPLAGLIAVSRPRTLREWWWLAAAALWIGATVPRSGGIAEQAVLALGVFITGTFVGVALRDRRPFFSMALLALFLAMPILVLWAWHLGIGWDELRLAVIRDGHQLQDALSSLPSAGDGGATAQYVDALSAGIESAAALFPGLLALTALLGMYLAWHWYHRIAAHPLGAPAGPFQGFRFSDHLVWGAITGLALTILPLPAPAGAVGANILVLFGGLYVLRGAAVLRAAAGETSVFGWLIVGVIVIFLLPIALGVLISLGLADTWLDFRRRFAPPTLGG